jgi:hypothetical protein
VGGVLAGNFVAIGGLTRIRRGRVLAFE